MTVPRFVTSCYVECTLHCSRMYFIPFAHISHADDEDGDEEEDEPVEEAKADEETQQQLFHPFQERPLSEKGNAIAAAAGWLLDQLEQQENKEDMSELKSSTSNALAGDD